MFHGEEAVAVKSAKYLMKAVKRDALNSHTDIVILGFSHMILGCNT